MKTEIESMQAIAVELAAQGADAGRIAHVAVSTWRDISTALSPIVGQRGIAALYKRSLYLIRAGHPWLAAEHKDVLAPGDFTTLHTALSQQTSSDAAAAHGALLQTFYNLLAGLIGESLSARMFRSVSNNVSSGLTSQESKQ